MPEFKKLLKFTAATVTSTRLEVDVKNESGAPLTESLLITMKFMTGLVDTRLRDAVKQAKPGSQPPNMKNVGDLVSVGGGLSVWVFNDLNEDVVTLRIVNSLKPDGQKLDKPVKIDTSAAFKLGIPLSESGSRARVTIPCIYKYFGQDGPPIPDSFEFTPADREQWQPKVSLTVDRPNPTMLEPGEKVRISWSIADGVSATLRGPLQAGHSELTLKKERSAYMIENGWLEIYAVGQATYILDAEVRRGPGPKVQVVRTLLLDTKSVDKYASLRVRPNRTLPNGQVEIDWAVWGVKTATLRIGKRSSFKLTLTEQDASLNYQGSGIWREKAANTEESVSLVIDDFEPKYGKIEVAEWQKTEKPIYRGEPVGMAVAGPHMALLTAEGIWVTEVGLNDRGSSDPHFEKKASIDASKSPIAISAFDAGFVVLLRTKDRLQLARYGSDGKLNGTPLDLEDRLSLLHRAGAFSHSVIFDLAAIGERVYVVMELRMFGGSFRTAYSVRFSPREHVQSESLLERLYDYRLLSFGGALFALHRASGQMVRFDIPDEGEIEAEHVRKAASAVNGNQSLVRTGLLSSTGGVLVVMAPEEQRMLKSAPLFSMINVATFALENPGLKRETKEVSTDLIYNPQKDHWSACGRGLKVKSGGVAAFRGGESERMWLLQPDGEMHTLMEASGKLFAPDYVDNFPLKSLPPILNAKLSLRITNESKLHMGSADDVQLLSGIGSVSSAALVEVEPPSHTFTLPFRNTQIFEINYHKNDPPPVSLRFLVERSNKPQSPLYFLEVTLSGDNLSSISSVFKRLMIDGANKVSIDEVVDTRAQYPLHRPLDDRTLRQWRRQNPGKPNPEGPIVVQPPKRLAEQAKLVICNASPYQALKSDSRSPFNGFIETTIDYLTPSFSISAYPGPNYHKFGEFRFDINFALPHGVEVCSRNLTQQHLLRIDSDNARGLAIESATILKPGDPPLTVQYQEGEKTFTAVNVPIYICRIIYREHADIDGIYIGKGHGAFLGGERSYSVYLPVARPENVSQAQVLKVNPDTLAITRSEPFPGGGVFALPNKISRSNQNMFAMFAGANLQIMGESLKSKSRKNLGDYTAVLDMATSSQDDIYLLAMKKEQSNPVKYHYVLAVGHAEAGQPPWEISLDAVRGLRDQNRIPGAPTWVSPSTISPIAVSPLNEASGRRVAVCIEGGMMLIATRSEKIEVVSFESAGREEDVVFDDRGEWLYCLHSQSNNQGLALSRVRLSSLKEKQTVLLPSNEPLGALLSETPTGGNTGVPPRQIRAASLLFSQSPDSLFVSQGRTIMRVDPESLAVRRTLAVDLPCQVVLATRGSDYSGWLLYAVGAAYKGDGKSAGEFQTRLYKLALPLE